MLLSHWALLLSADGDIYFPTTIDALIEQDLKKLTLDSEKKKADNDDNDDDNNNDDGDDDNNNDDGDDEEEEEKEEEKKDDELEKAEGNSEKRGTVELLPVVTPYIPSPPGSPYGYGMYSKPQDSNSGDDDLVLGVRIYTQGGAVVSVTGQVVNEEIIEVDEHNNAAKGKEDDKKDAKDDKKEDEDDKNEDEDDKKEDEDDKKEDEDNKKEGKKAKKAKDKKKHACIPYP